MWGLPYYSAISLAPRLASCRRIDGSAAQRQGQPQAVETPSVVFFRSAHSSSRKNYPSDP